MQDLGTQENYMKTFTGKKVNPIYPQEERIDLRDIAHALSLICRGNGQTTHFYSVAQHCLNCETEAEARDYSDRIRLACLLHDGSEAYMCDMIRPLKKEMPLYREIEDRFLQAIYTRFLQKDLTEEEAVRVKEIDDCLLEYDLTELLGEPMPKEGYQFHRIPDIEFVPFEEVEARYLQKAHELMQRIGQATD